MIFLVGPGGDCRKRAYTNSNKLDKQKQLQGEKFKKFFLGVRESCVGEAKGGPPLRGSAIFEPPEGNVQEERYDDERFIVKQHFVFANIWKMQEGDIPQGT